MTFSLNAASSQTGLLIRPAVESDCEVVLSLIKELAVYEKMIDEVVATVETVRESLFGERPAAECVIAEYNGAAVGFALFFHNYSTFLSRRGLYLEDLFVKPEYRGKGFGRALLVYLARLAVERGCGRFEWAVLDWNEPAIGFYKKLGAVAMDEWTVYRLSGAALLDLAREEL